MSITDGATLGLLLTNLLTLGNISGNFITSMTKIMSEISSVERVREYVSSEENEEDENVIVVEAPKFWLENSPVIKIRNLKVKYRKNLPLVLNGIDLDFKPNQKIGIVGRSGSGKSTLLLALMRIIEMEEDSKIEIDGLDISKIGLKQLRDKIEVIP